MNGRRPLIGVTAGSTDVTILEGSLPAFYAGRANPRAIIAAGGDPVILGAVAETDPGAPERYADALDGFVFAGGVDIAPSLYGGSGSAEEEEVADHARDRFEVALIEAARQQGKPILGVCRGMQLINVAFGGTIVDGVEHHVEPAPMDGFDRVVRHRIDLEPASLAADVYGTAEVEVACLHHQRTGEMPAGLSASGWASDGVVEAIEGAPEEPFLLGLLWHPEYTFDQDPTHLRPYQALIRAARGEQSTAGAEKQAP
jgi:putative glutamine amidotransferase